MMFKSRLFDGRNSSAIFWTVFFLATCLLFVPLFVTEIPPVLDYPNHLARMYVLAKGPDDPVISRMYVQQWGVIPDLGIDLTVPWMLSFLPLNVAGRVMLAAALVLPVIGTVAYSRSLFGRGSLWPLGSFLVAYNLGFMFGFINLLLSYGMALLSAALLYKYARHNIVLHSVIGAICAIVVFFTHIVGLGLLLMLIASCKLVDIIQVGAVWKNFGQELFVQGLGYLVIVAGPLILYYITNLDVGAIQTISWDSGIDKLKFLIGPFLNYYFTLDLATVALVVSIFMLLIITRKVFVSMSTFVVAIILFIAYPYIPLSIKSAGFVNARIPVALGFLSFCVFMPRNLPRLVVIGLSLILASLFVLRTAVIAQVWYGHNQDLADVRRTIEPIEPGSRVLVVNVQGPGADYFKRAGDPDLQPGVPRSRYISTLGFPMYGHMAALVLIERRAFWPLLFADPSKQPLRVLEPYQELSNPAGGLPFLGGLQADSFSKSELKLFPYLADWRSQFDYVLVLNAGVAGDLHEYWPDRLLFLGQNDFSALFRIKK